MKVMLQGTYSLWGLWHGFFRDHLAGFVSLLVLIAARTSHSQDVSPEPGIGKAAIVEVRKIWDRAPHNAFTDLVRSRDRWFCVFREGHGHVSPDGSIRVIASSDGRDWSSSALLALPGADLRDPKITQTPDGRLMIVVGYTMMALTSR